MTTARARLWLGGGLVLAVLAAAYWFTRSDPGDSRLRSFVRASPPVPVVFTSRSDPASLIAAAAEWEGFTAPSRPLWAAREGRLRLLSPRGTVHELTWDKPLPDGDTLIDVMSPSISIDCRRVLFAGRRRADGHSRFRLYEINVDGSGLRQLTGGPDDEGCAALPPLRWRADGSTIPDAERRAVDYDDVDPIELNDADRRIAFVSSRTPDLGRDHSRRSTTLWILHANGDKHAVSANRNNDRWPFLLSSGYIAFGIWSRNREVVAEDRTDVRPYVPEKPGATSPTDSWLGAFTRVPGGHFGMLVKPNQPVWRPRPLFSNRITFMTTFAPPGSYGENPPLTVVQTPPGFLASVPSAIGTGQSMPQSSNDQLHRGPDRNAAGRPIALATPSPCPPAHVLLAGAPIPEGAILPRPGDYGLHLASDDWRIGDDPNRAARIGLQLLFDDPDFVDAEPVAVYERALSPQVSTSETPVRDSRKVEMTLASGEVYRGSVGRVFATAIDSPSLMRDLPGQSTDSGEKPIYDSPPPGRIDHLRLYAARRDRFDDPVKPRVPGSWEMILRVPVVNGVAATEVPTDSPSVLAGFDKNGRVARWTTGAKDRQGRSAEFYAYAGDHYSLTRPEGKHFCVGCHPGHSGLDPASHNHAERLKN